MKIPSQHNNEKHHDNHFYVTDALQTPSFNSLLLSLLSNNNTTSTTTSFHICIDFDSTIEFCIPPEVLLFHHQHQVQQNNDDPCRTTSAGIGTNATTASNQTPCCCCENAVTSSQYGTNDSETRDCYSGDCANMNMNSCCGTTNGSGSCSCCCSIHDNYYNEDVIKDWIIDHCREQLRSAIRVKSINHSRMATQNHESNSNSNIQNSNKDICRIVQPETNPRKIPSNDSLQERLVLYDHMNQVQRQYVSNDETAPVLFNKLLDGLIDVTASEYGFIGEVKYEDDGETMYLLCHAATNIAWDDASREFYEQNIANGLKFSNLDTLFGHVMKTGIPFITNDAPNHPKAGGIPPGHPPLNHFLGLPYRLPGSTAKVDGMVGVANKPGGYTQTDIDLLEPFLLSCSSYVHMYRLNAQNVELITKLEDLVQQRTEELNQANQAIVESARMQIEHFACMSHELRTPLNCVVGLSSVLAETELNPFQKDSLQMIIQSSELLMAVVNDVLDYSKLQTGNMLVDIHETNLQDTIDAVVHSIERKMPEKNITVRTNYDYAIPEIVQSDSRRLQQILYNLLGNAVKFSYPNGVVELSVSVVCANIDSNNNNNNSHVTANVNADDSSYIADHGDTGNPLPISPNTTKTTNTLNSPARHISDPKSPNQSLFDAALQDFNVLTTSASKSNTTEKQHNTTNSKGCPFQYQSSHQQEIPKSSSFPFSLPPATEAISQTFPATQNELDTILHSSCCSSTEEARSFGQKSIERNQPIGNESDNHLSSHQEQDDERQKPRTKLEKQSSSSQYRLRIVVKDNGKGIAKEDFDRIFQPFQQASKTKTTTAVTDTTGNCSPHTTATSKSPLPEGTGLGLAITSRLVEGLGGIITVDSELGQWSEFALEIPLLGTPYSQANWDKYKAKGKEPTRILLVSKPDDHETTAETIRSKFRIDPVIPVYQYKSCDGFLTLTSHEQSILDPTAWRNVCIIDEDLFDRTLYTTLVKSSSDLCVLVTYGPNYSVQESDHHYRSLHKILPSIVVRSLHQCQQRLGSVRKSNSNHISALPSTESLKITQPNTSSRIIDLSSHSFHKNHPSIVKTPPNSPEAPIANKTNTDCSSYRVLIAEDNKINQKILVSMLQRVGVRTIDVVENGQLAYEHATTKSYDIIFMDMQMPLMSGLEATEAIVSKLGRNRDAPVIIFVTAHATKDYEDKAREVGGNGFLAKPFNLNSIRNVLESIHPLLPTTIVQ